MVEINAEITCRWLWRATREQVALGMYPTSLPAGVLQDPADRRAQPGVRVTDHQPHAAKAAVNQVAEELGPEGLVLAVAHVDTEDFAVAVSAAAGRDHHRFGHDLAVLADVHVGRVEPHIDERLMIQPAAAEHGHVVVDGLADPADRRLAHPGVAAQRLDQVVDLAGGGAGDVGAHDHRPQRLVDPAAGFEQLGEEAALPQLGDADLHVPGRRGHQLGAVPVAQVGP